MRFVRPIAVPLMIIAAFGLYLQDRQDRAGPSEADRIKVLEAECARLKQLLVDSILEGDALKAALEQGRT